MRRSPIGSKRKTRVQHELNESKALEGTSDRLGLFQLHHVDWFHNEQPQRDRGTLKEGVPDYLIIYKGWLGWLEIKSSKAKGRLSAGQLKFHALLREAGQEVWTAYLPEDLEEINQWLKKQTGVSANIDGLLNPN